jgi:hypothetical protein
MMAFESHSSQQRALQVLRCVRVALYGNENHSGATNVALLAVIIFDFKREGFDDLHFCSCFRNLMKKIA